MGQYLSPGVYVEEVSGGSKPIEGVGTSTGAFVGIAKMGPIGVAKEIANWTQFVNTFGSYTADGYLAYAVSQFFSEGGTRCYVVRTCHYEDDKKTSASSTATLKDDKNDDTINVTASSDGKWSEDVSIEIKKATDLADGVKLIVKYKGTEEIFDNLTNANIEEIVNNKSAFIRMSREDPERIPKVDQTVKLAGGKDGIKDDDGKSTLIAADFEGDEKLQNGLHAFDTVDDINIVAIPDGAANKDINKDVISAGLKYCGLRKDCFFIADPTGDLDPMAVRTFRSGLNSSYGALYYPWVIISDPLTGKKKTMPPSGAVAGTYAHTDSVRGVHKAPAGISEGFLDSVSGVERIITKSEHDGLNPVGINVIRSFPTSGICIWGARTLSADPEWKYINIRRLFLFLEESIDKGTQWVVFEPNDPALWGKVKRNLTAFLSRVWRDGALFGGTPEEAFYVKVDAENNPPEVRDAGQLVIEVGVAPVRPAEFVIIRISQKTLEK
ncbi:phage tail sheath protein FI [Candidatus Methanoperedens nitroreducens]|uniref:Phage tail sheath protein FI n=1 Tax=Candidatus Methanoperedens nitratireducens TaxID=1392998 RepID=A0A062UZH4_9EURY|nr:phage tail sheath C-terminal domain-containing protein [Candidatus Methanoperedens nitroreducens]KCZ70557.1 phage tail sheath protein FI [Candidatus Methanoperedens nitroreducens]MDJ1420408.1 phage tail sheath subtilisin-like domain-containing protein [Candidatus Methanoperedens sp.]